MGIFGAMKHFSAILIVGSWLAFTLSGFGQAGGDIEPMLAETPTHQPAMLDATPTDPQPEQAARVTAVYGVGVDDYLPLKEVARQHLRPNVRSNASHPGLDLPDAFFFIGAPVFILIFLRVMVIFLNGFEEKRQQELRLAAREYVPDERLAGE